MPATENQGSSFLSRSIQSIRRNQVASVSMEGKQEQELQHVDLFLKHVGDRFQDLFSFFSGDGDGDDENHSRHHHRHLLLNLPWLRKLLDAFLCCEEEFKAILLLNPKPSLFSTRLLSDLLDRSLKALDLCNAISMALDSLRRSHDLAHLSLSALRQHPLGPGQFRRAGKALKTILTTITNKDPTATAERSWSFGRKSKSGHLQSSVSSTWSAAKQLQAYHLTTQFRIHVHNRATCKLISFKPKTYNPAMNLKTQFKKTEIDASMNCNRESELIWLLTHFNHLFK